VEIAQASLGFLFVVVNSMRVTRVLTRSTSRVQAGQN